MNPKVVRKVNDTLERFDMLDETNCMGYALRFNELMEGNYFLWLRVKGFEHLFEEDYYDYHDYIKDLDKRFSQSVSQLLEDFPLKLVKRSDMKQGKRYVAYREAQDDFHFMVRDGEGYWSHKMGHDIVRSVSEEEVFGEYWDTPYIIVYDSEIALFEVIE